MASTMISARGIRKRFGGRWVLDGVDLEILEGETHVILGRSGTGKSVLLKLITGLLTPEGGELSIDGCRLDLADPASVAAMRRKVQMLFQAGALFDSMTIAQNVAFHAVEHGQATLSRAQEVARPYLEMVDLADSGPRMPSELSGGMRKRAALARALAAKPRVMLYDEPTTGLDPVTAQVINRLIRQTQRQFKVTSVVVTHDLRSAQEVGDRCSFLHEGRILETSTPTRLSASSHRIVRAFVEEAVALISHDA